MREILAFIIIKLCVGSFNFDKKDDYIDVKLEELEIKKFIKENVEIVMDSFSGVYYSDLILTSSNETDEEK